MMVQKSIYNVQHGVDSEYIVWLTVGDQPTDTNTLIPFLKSMEQFLQFKYEKIVADAGYESEENYVYEALNRSLDITAIVRDSSKLSNKKVTVLQKDIFHLNSSDLKQFDVVINERFTVVSEPD